jgi:Protein of unknown function (DUF2804)
MTEAELTSPVDPCRPAGRLNPAAVGWSRCPLHAKRVDAAFRPFHEKAARTSVGVLANETHRCFGRFAGWARVDDGTGIGLDGLVGWAEEARNRWQRRPGRRLEFRR